MKLHKQKPRHVTSITPQQIQGKYSGLMEKHFAIWKQFPGEDAKREAALRRAGVTPEHQKRIAELYTALREHGFYVSGVSTSGRLSFQFALSDAVFEQVINEEYRELCELTVENCIKEGKKRYGKLMSK